MPLHRAFLPERQRQALRQHKQHGLFMLNRSLCSRLWFAAGIAGNSEVAPVLSGVRTLANRPPVSLRVARQLPKMAGPLPGVSVYENRPPSSWRDLGESLENLQYLSGSERFSGRVLSCIFLNNNNLGRFSGFLEVECRAIRVPVF